MIGSVITPHYIEDITFSLEELHSSQEEVSIIFYMQKIFPGYYEIWIWLWISNILFVQSSYPVAPILLDEWKNFLERIGCENLESLQDGQKKEELRQWASFRGQTLSRTGTDNVIFTKLNVHAIVTHCVIVLNHVTARGMMYYREALKLQAFLDMAEDQGL